MSYVRNTILTVNELIHKSNTDKTLQPDQNDIDVLKEDIENVELEMESICEILSNTLLAKRYSVYNSLSSKQSNRMEEY